MAVSPPAADIAALPRAVVRGVAWGAIIRWSAQACTWIGTLAVARLLTPADYGIVGSATVLVGLAGVVSEFGVGLTVITLRDLTARQIAQLNGLAILLGVAAFGALAVSAPLVARFFERPELTAVTIAMAVTFVAAGARTVPAALLQRELRFPALAAIEAFQSIVGAAVALTAAWQGWGYWALVASAVAASFAWTTMIVATRPFPIAGPDRAELGRALAFTRHQLTGSLAWYCYSNADFVVAGRTLRAHDLGLYAMGWTLARVVPERVSQVATRLTPAIFATLQNDRAALRAWLSGVIEALAVVSFPLLLGLAVVAADAIPIALGPQWTAASVPLQLLAVYGAFDAVTQPLTRALNAVGDVRFTARVGVVMATVMPVGFVAGAAWGPTGLAATWLVLAPAIRSTILRRAGRTIGFNGRSLVRALWPAASATAIMVAAVLALSHAAVSWPREVRLIASCIAGAASYAAALGILHPRRVRAWWTLWREIART